MGILFVLGVMYIGVDTPWGPVYLGLGLVSLLASIGLAVSRGRGQAATEKNRSDDSTAT